MDQLFNRFVILDSRTLENPLEYSCCYKYYIRRICCLQGEVFFLLPNTLTYTTCIYLGNLGAMITFFLLPHGNSTLLYQFGPCIFIWSHSCQSLFATLPVYIVTRPWVIKHLPCMRRNTIIEAKVGLLGSAPSEVSQRGF